MYSPQYAIETNKNAINEVIRENPFATLVFNDEKNIQSFHLPLLLKDSILVGHMARANTAWKALDGQSVLAIFHGPHCYISPVWFGNQYNVPTWNYISVQVRGEVKIKNDAAFLKETLIDLAREHDQNFNIEKNVHDNQELFSEIVGIEITITDIFGKFKLAQSKTEEERINIIGHLEKSSDQSQRLVAKAMQKTLHGL